MEEATTQDAYSGYGFAIRTFWFNVTDFHLHRVWSRESLITDKPEFSNFVTGKAVSEDRVGVIGREGSVNEFDFTLRVDTDAKKSWDWHRRISGFDTADQSKFKPEYVRIKKLIDERLDADPPTAALFSSEADWEIGTKAGWFIECKVPPAIFSQMENEIASMTVNSVSIGVEWEAGLVRDEHAPPSVPTIWGLFCLEGNRSPEMLRGHVKSIRWSPSNRAKQTPPETDEPSPISVASPDTDKAPVILTIPKSAIAALWVLALAAILHLFG